MYLNIKMLEDFRTLKQGDEFNFDFSKHPEILIAGDNGCGKSTLVNIIRDYQCDNSKDDPNAMYQTKLGYCDIKGFKNKIEISTDFTKFYFISAEFDDPTSLNNSASAEALLENGGFQTKRMSTGQRSLTMLGKWLKEKQEPYKYVILDDDSDMLDTQSNNFIRTDWRAGLTEENVNKAIKILNG